jgi:2-polyprenyl-3-methyl-5-hydroxy-6-metoxy-1,4-benzoquinol methylase
MKAASKDERETLADFAERYRTRASSRTFDEIERAVIGEAWGANGFTTVDQARRLLLKLDLRPKRRLLDVGSGCGWPGLFLARETGCDVVVSDLPLDGLEMANRRAESEGLKMLGAVASSARHFPFAEGSFDAIVHVDVIC